MPSQASSPAVRRTRPVSTCNVASPGLSWWKGPEFAHAGGAAALKQAAEDADIALYVHAPYVLNVATTNNRIRMHLRQLSKPLAGSSSLST